MIRVEVDTLGQGGLHLLVKKERGTEPAEENAFRHTNEKRGARHAPVSVTPTGPHTATIFVFVAENRDHIIDGGESGVVDDPPVSLHSMPAGQTAFRHGGEAQGQEIKTEKFAAPPTCPYPARRPRAATSTLACSLPCSA